MKKLLFILLPLLAFASLSQVKAQIKIACVGNSITQGPGRDNPDSYPLQMQAILGDGYEVKNSGVSGRTMLKKGDYPYWNEPQFEEVKNFQPDILVIKLGTNDSKPQNWQYKDDFVSDYVALIDEYKKHMPKKGKVFICIPVPVFKDNFGIRERVLVDEMRPMLLEIAKKSKAKLIDLYAPFEGKSALLPDGVHPNKEGLGIMARSVADSITK